MRLRHRISTAFAAVACAALVGCATVATLGTDSNTALKELNAVHKTRDQALASRDAATLSNQHAADLEVRLADGTKLDRAGFEALLQKTMESRGPAPSVIRQLSQEGAGYVAVVTPGLEGPRSALRETWQKTGEGWKLKAVEEIANRSEIASTNGHRRGPS